jgi:phosphoesterase RecJ-like protein
MTINETAKLLDTWNNLYILTHQRPDGDTLGSAAALCEGLRSLGKTSYVLKNPDITERYLPFVSEYLWNGPIPDDAILVSVDVAQPSLLPKAYEAFSSRIALVIDHHETNSGFGAVSCVFPGCAATGEIIYDLLISMGVAITRTVAWPLYLALSTDTGCFRYSNVTPHTHRVAAALLETGIPFTDINQRMFEIQSLERIKVESLLLKTMELLDGGTIALCFLTLDVMELSGAHEDDVDNISSFPRKIAGVDIGVTLKEHKNDIWKISVRTSQRWPANQICARLGGGGHVRAAGCECRGSLKEVRQKMLDAVAALKKDI